MFRGSIKTPTLVLCVRILVTKGHNDNHTNIKAKTMVMSPNTNKVVELNHHTCSLYNSYFSHPNGASNYVNILAQCNMFTLKHH